MKELCVVHLVRASNDLNSFRIFLESYCTHPGGVEHDLLIVFKGFDKQHYLKRYKALLSTVEYKTLHVSDHGYDITAYLSAVDHYVDRYRYFCFLNSHSVIQDAHWLRKLHDGISSPEVGLAGATGSWNSNFAAARSWLNDAYKEILQLPRSQFGTIAASDSSITTRPIKNNFLSVKVPRFFRNVWNNVRLLVYFSPFPNYHVRTNTFIISGKLMRSIKFPLIRSKMDAYRYESGKNGLTLQLLNMGKKVVVVGKDGIAYEKEDWHKSKTFWCSNQENLLVADNQTRDYQEGTPARRSYLASIAWGSDLSVKSDD